jgi:hypothetical protein
MAAGGLATGRGSTTFIKKDMKKTLAIIATFVFIAGVKAQSPAPKVATSPTVSAPIVASPAAVSIFIDFGDKAGPVITAPVTTPVAPPAKGITLISGAPVKKS